MYYHHPAADVQPEKGSVEGATVNSFKFQICNHTSPGTKKIWFSRRLTLEMINYLNIFRVLTDALLHDLVVGTTEIGWRCAFLRRITPCSPAEGASPSLCLRVSHRPTARACVRLLGTSVNSVKFRTDAPVRLSRLFHFSFQL